MWGANLASSKSISRLLLTKSPVIWHIVGSQVPHARIQILAEVILGVKGMSHLVLALARAYTSHARLVSRILILIIGDRLRV